MNDSCLIFGFSDGIFKYSIYNDSLNLLTQMIGKSIDAISLNRKDNLIAFSYQDGFEEYKPKKIGFYNSLTDSIFYHDKRASFLGNWSPDRSTLVFCSTDNIILYDSHSSKFNIIEKMMGTEDIVFWECFFINSKELLAHGSKNWGIEESNFYIYNIETNSITSQLTHDDLAKVELSFSN